MLYRKIALASVLALIAKVATASSVSILFVGNSLTSVNDLPTVLKRFAAESSLHVDVDVRSITPGGAFLYDQWKHGQALTMLREQHPNFLILQGQSTEPLSSPQNFNYYARLFKAEADQTQTKTVLFSTWARPASDSYYKDSTSGGSPTEMQARLNSAYASLAQNIGATLAPVGIAWQRAQQVAPDIQLLDGTQHPSPAGTYLAAAVLFRVIFNTSPVGSTYYGGLPQTTAHTLQRIADAIPLNAAQ
jgi:uncharacterized protein DUF4886